MALRVGLTFSGINFKVFGETVGLMATECLRSREKHLYDISKIHSVWDGHFQFGQTETSSGGFVLPDKGSKGSLPPCLRSRTIDISINGPSIGYHSPGFVRVGIGPIAGETGGEIYRMQQYVQFSGYGIPKLEYISRLDEIDLNSFSGRHQGVGWVVWNKVMYGIASCSDTRCASPESALKWNR